jgi:histidinol-phosphate aminotransferase
VPVAKAHLAKVQRSNPHSSSRKGYLRLDMNEGVPGLPEDFVTEVRAEMDAQFLATYPEYEALQEKVARHNGIFPENIILSNGSDGAIKYIFDAYVSPGDRILLTDPTFAMYPVYCQIFAARPVVLSCRADLSFSAEDFQRQLAGDIRLAVVVNPNNPTGYAFPPAQLLAMIREASEHDVLLVVDEAYFYFYPATVIGEINRFDNLIVLRTFSKLCGLAAARLGYAAASPNIIENLRKVRPTYDVNGLAVALAEKLLENSEIIPKLIKGAAAGKVFLVRKLVDADIAHQAGEANFVLIRCNKRLPELIKRLAEEQILVGGEFSHPHLRNYLRVTVGRREIMEAFWEKFIFHWRKLNG